MKEWAAQTGIDQHAGTPDYYTAEEKKIIFLLGTGAGAVPGKFGISAPAPASVASTKEVFKYAPRVRARGVQDPKAHNFPYSFDSKILSTQPTYTSSGYRIYQAPGTMNGKVGVFEIGVTPKSVIDHRFFRPN